MTINKLLDVIAENYPGITKINLQEVDKAYNFAKEAHKGQKRATGADYIQHPLHTANILADMKMPIPVIIAGLLHDVPENTAVKISDIKKEFGTDIANMVEGVTKAGYVKYRGLDRYVENIRKMFIAMTEDIRVIIIKFADRLHNLDTLYALPANKQKRIALESLEIFAPIANRLGMGDLQGKLEDGSFKYAYPDKYLWIEQLVKKRSRKLKQVLDHMTETLKKEFDNGKIKYLKIYGREKHYYSLYRKLMKYEKNMGQVYDLVAARIIVPDVQACYAVLGIIHSLWKPVKERIKDYIAQPKPNGYQSLHTTVFGEEGEIVEFQIRTPDMNKQAEMGIASHWKYKELKARSAKDIGWVKDLAKLLKDKDKKTLDKVKIDIFQNRIFVFTPNGDVIDLPDGATPVDFAYHIHSNIGNQCAQSYVNNQFVPLDTKLKNGDIVKIVVNKKRKGPNPRWLKFVKTRTARNHITAFARKQGWKKFIPL